MVVDALATILDKAKAAGHICGITPHLAGGSGISMLQYADDTIIMVEGSDTDSLTSSSFFSASNKCLVSRSTSTRVM